MKTKLSLKAKVYTLDALAANKAQMDSIQVMREVNARIYKEDRSTNENYNWHEFSNYLQDLECSGLIETCGIGPTGMTRYQIAKIRKPENERTDQT